MTVFQPRIPLKFMNEAGTGTFTFPLAEYSFEFEQPLYAPSAAQSGAHGEMDMLRDGIAPKGPGLVRLGFTVFEDHPKTVEVTIDEMLQKIFSYGRGKLYTQGLDSSGAEQLRWTRARAMAMPSLRWAGGDVLSKAASIGFRTDPFWYGETAIAALSVAAQGTLTVAVQPTATDTFTIGATVYTFVASGANDAGEINVGASLAAAQVNIVAAINGTDGWNNPNALATAADFAANACVVTAVTAGVASDSIVFTEAFTSGSNVMDGAGTLGGTRAGTASATFDPSLGSFSITNSGNAPIYNAIITLAGTYTNPVIRNSTNGYQVESATDGSSAAHLLRFDAGRPAVEKSTNTGTSWANDYANFVRQAGQVHLMVLDPGVNNFLVTGCSSGTLELTAYPAYH